MRKFNSLKYTIPGIGALVLLFLIAYLAPLHNVKACDPPPENLTITGYTTVGNCYGYLTYSIQSPTPGSCYVWSVPSGAAYIHSGQYTDEITVNYECFSQCYEHEFEINMIILFFDTANGIVL